MAGPWATQVVDTASHQPKRYRGGGLDSRRPETIDRLSGLATALLALLALTPSHALGAGPYGHYEELPLIEPGIPVEPLEPGWETVALSDIDPDLLVRDANDLIAELRDRTADPTFLDKIVSDLGQSRSAGYVLRVIDFLLRYVGVAFGFDPGTRPTGLSQDDRALDTVSSGRTNAIPLSYSDLAGGFAELRITDVLRAVQDQTDAAEGRHEGFAVKPGVQFLVLPEQYLSGSYRVLSELQVKFRYDFRPRHLGPMRVEVVPRCLVGVGINETADFGPIMAAYNGVTFAIAGQEFSCSLGAAFYWGM